MKWFSDLINPNIPEKDTSAWLKIMSWCVAALLSLCSVYLIFKGSISGDSAVNLLIVLVVIFMSASGLVVLGDKGKQVMDKLAEEKTKRAAIAPPASPSPPPKPLTPPGQPAPSSDNKTTTSGSTNS